jgi:DNA (cytosine-5)-methyltransferase 1
LTATEEGNVLTVGSLFSGIGGIELGLERTRGFKTIWFSDIEPYTEEIRKRHWPEAKELGDITKIKWQAVTAPEVLTGGFPCQDISSAGKQAGIKGKKSGLWKEYLKAISILRPKYIIAENVAALLNRGIETILSDLAKIGYDAEWHCIPASKLGSPHRRDRIFIIAYPNTLYQETGEKVLREYHNIKVANTPSISTIQRITKQKPIITRISKEITEFSSKIKNWQVEPGLGRVAHGVPNCMDRLKSLGNAVVPQVAQFIGEQIKKYEVEKNGRSI